MQNHHWSKKQATVHPVVIHVKSENGEIITEKLCFISDDHKDHNAPMVQKFQEKIVTFIKEKYPHVTEVIYVTDGSASQYKNCTGFLFLER